jgi:hypothetical protein
MMSIAARRELVREVSPRYRSACKLEKGRILDELVAVTGYDRKYALRLLKAPPPVANAKRTRKRKRTYTDFELRALARIWPVSGYLGSRRLVAALGPLTEALERHGEWVPEPGIRQKLLKMSASTCERMLSQIRPRHKPKGLSLTRPGTLKRQIAIRRGTDWQEDRPGFIEADLVAHSGSECIGEFFYTLTMTDVSTGWTEMAPLRTKGQGETLVNIKSIRSRLPFELVGIDSDNGSEFINHHLMRYCGEEGIIFTRGRPYAKNDGCRVEQKNWAVVRRHVGYGRFASEAHFKALKEIYGILRLLTNFFEPSAKLLGKKRTERGTQKELDSPKTPYQRVLQSEHVSQQRKECLNELYLSLNPAALRRRLQALKRDLQDELMVSFLDEAPN